MRVAVLGCAAVRLDEISAALRALDEAHLLRLPESESALAARRDWVDFASNDYLGLAGLTPRGEDVSRETLGAELSLGSVASVLDDASATDTPPPGSGSSVSASGAPTSGDVSRETLLAAKPMDVGVGFQQAAERTGVPAVTSALGRSAGRRLQQAAERAGVLAGVPLDASGRARGVSRETSNEPGAFAGGSGASRLVFGTHPAHLAAEAELADWLGYDGALCFSSGYAANVGALGALLSPEDCVISDELNHASLIDGIRLSRARPTIVRHLDLDALEAALHAGQGAPARWVVLESYSSMDGDGPDLGRVRQLCDRYEAHLYLDEAHGVGLFGPEGRGRAAEAGVHADVLMAGLGKAVGAQGGAVLGSRELCVWLWNRARSFVFSTAPAPLTATTLRERVARVRAADVERARVHALAASTRGRLAELGYELGVGSFGPILGLRLGEAERALRWAAELRAAGFLVQAIRPPTVPPGGSRLRLTLRASHRAEDIERLLACLANLRDRKHAP